MEEQEQNRTEEATPFKLKRAREKGRVARGMDLGFVGSLLALATVMMLAGPAFVQRIADLMRVSFTTGIDRTDEPQQVLATVSGIYWLAFEPIFILGLVIVVLLVLLELLQLRGFVFSAEPLKPDFKRLNPINGLKRLFSIRMLKETLKNIVKLAAYTAIAWFLISGAVMTLGDTLTDARSVGVAMAKSGTRLLLSFIGAAFAFMVIDQIIVRGEFRKQMRMSRRELTREIKEREGEPRLKQKRKQLHQEMRSQADGLGKVPGSDFLLTNPEHYAIALKYDSQVADAPIVRARGRNHFAQLLKRKARLVGVPIIRDPALARALYCDSRQGKPIDPQHFHAVARHYLALRNGKAPAGETGSHAG